MSGVQSGAFKVLNQLRGTNSVKEINEALARFCLNICCSHFLLAPGPDNILPIDEDLTEIGNFPDIIREIYRSEINAIKDPARFEAINSGQAMQWRNVFLETRGRQEREFINLLRENHLRDGISIPVHGPRGCMAILMFAGHELLEFGADDLDNLILIAYATVQRLKHIIAARIMTANIGPEILTIREQECLKWVIHGKTNWEIGVLMGIGARTVQFHLANCQRKLGVNNRIQAAFQAILLGHVEIPAQYRKAGRIKPWFETKSMPFAEFNAIIARSVFRNEENQNEV